MSAPGKSYKDLVCNAYVAVLEEMKVGEATVGTILLYTIINAHFMPLYTSTVLSAALNTRTWGQA